MFPGGVRTAYMIQHMLPGMYLYYADPAQPLTAVGEELDDLDHDLSRGVQDPWASERPVGGRSQWTVHVVFHRWHVQRQVYAISDL